MAGSLVDANCRVVPTRLTATTLTTCFTATGYTQIIGVRIANFHASSTPIVHYLYYQKPLNTAFYLQANYLMPVATSLWFPYDAFALYEDDEIRVQASIANTVDVTVFIAEVPGRSA